MPTCGSMGGLKANGDPCMRDIAPGFTRCNLHGAKNASAKIKAEHALAIARLPACEALYSILDQWEHATCVTCGYPSGDVDTLKMIVRTCQVILDRSGMGPRSTVEHLSKGDDDFNLELLLPAELIELDRLLLDMSEFKARVQNRIAAGPTDGSAVAVPQPTQEM